MTTHNDKKDQLLDRNLFQIGREVPLPEEPTEFQQSRWKQPPTPDATARIVKGVKLMKRHRLFAFLGAGSVVAACVALSVMFFSPGANNRVEAATIFQSFRDSFKRAFTLNFENVVDDGYRIDGQLLVVLHQGNGPKKSQHSIIAGDIEEEGAYLEMHIRSLVEDENTEDPELDVEFALAAAEGNEWLFFQTHAFPKQLRLEQPLVAMLASMTQNGVLVELGGMLRQGLLVAHMDLGAAPADGDTEESPPQSNGNLTFRVGVATGEPPPDTPEIALENGANIGFDFRTGSENEAPDLEARIARRQAQQEQALKAAATSLGVEYDQMVKFTEAINNMFTGQMTREQLSTVISWIESSAGEVSVDERDGLFVLTARDFDLSHLPLDEDSAAELAQNAIEIGYREETGVEWAAVLNIGDEQGKMTFEFVDRDTSDPVFDRERWLKGGDVRVFDLSGLGKLLSSNATSE